MVIDHLLSTRESDSPAFAPTVSPRSLSALSYSAGVMTALLKSSFNVVKPKATFFSGELGAGAGATERGGGGGAGAGAIEGGWLFGPAGGINPWATAGRASSKAANIASSIVHRLYMRA